MSIDEAGSLHEGFKEMMTWLTGNRVLGDGSIWWVAAYFFLLGPIGSRLLADMRECLTSTAALLAGAACYLVAVATQLEGILPQAGARAVMLEEGLEMFGNVFVLMAMLLHWRGTWFSTPRDCCPTGDAGRSTGRGTTTKTTSTAKNG